MTLSKLKIQPQPSPEKLAQQFFLIGTVDMEAIETLESLYVLPPNCQVELNFSQVDRVNSMGLAQLLKLFELWQNRRNQIRVTHTNRMIGILFKMTGLTRFLAEDLSADVVPVMPAPVAEAKKTEPEVVQPPLTDGLLITPNPSVTALEQHFNFNGVIDVNAVAVLEPLYSVPQKCTVTLDFAQIQRVNSMGLAQLLKLFQHWQTRDVNIRVINTNRMVGILFKMTGLLRFLADGQTLATESVSAEIKPPVTAAPQAKVPPITEAPAPLRRASDLAKPQQTAPAVQVATDKLNLWVSAQSSQQMNGWYFFNTYLQRHLGREVHLEVSHGAMAERRRKIEEHDIVFNKPFDATRLMLQHGYQPLLRPIDQTDEVTLLVRSEDTRKTLADYQGGKIVTAAPDSFVYLLGRFLLEESDASMADMEYVFSGHDIKALQMLLKGSADILFMLSDTYKGLSGLTRKMLREIDQSETAFAFHLFSVAPQCSGLGEALANVLLDMNRDGQGRQVLADLGISGWIKPTQDECDMLAMLFNRYALG